jgi:hypothetical protein
VEASTTVSSSWVFSETERSIDQMAQISVALAWPKQSQQQPPKSVNNSLKRKKKFTIRFD